jgi:hypothetical protein
MTMINILFNQGSLLFFIFLSNKIYYVGSNGIKCKTKINFDKQNKKHIIKHKG